MPPGISELLTFLKLKSLIIIIFSETLKAVKKSYNYRTIVTFIYRNPSMSRT